MTTGRGLLIKSGRIIDPSQDLDTLGDLLIAEGQIASLPEESSEGAFPVLDAQGCVVCPGFIDLHCHLREPGYEQKETIASGTAAAVRGGFTTVCSMANTYPPVDSQATVEYIQRTASRLGVARVLPLGAVTKGLAGQELAEMGELAEAGVVAYSDDGRPVADNRLMRHALEYSRMFSRPIVSHCEDLGLSDSGVMNEGGVATKLGLPGIPAVAEEVMVARDIALAELTGSHLHLAHLSTAGSVELVRQAKAKGLALTAEVTPHHLTLGEGWVAGTAHLPPYDTRTKVNPALRTAKDREALLAGLREGVIDAIATDHAPHALEDKLCEYDRAAFGICGLETALGLLMGLVHQGQLGLYLLIEKLTTGPARAFNLPFGTLRPGSPADVTVFDPQVPWVVEPEQFASKGKNTPLVGMTLQGRVLATIVKGEIAYLAPEARPRLRERKE